MTCLCAETNGNLWIGTGYGLCRFDGHGFQRYTTADGLAQDDITTLCQVGDGSVWIGTRGGLSRHHNGLFSTFSGR